jgi:transcriptional regulator with GAF, ATPase, and Fis domain
VWPGNVRELRNVIERAIIVSVGNRLRIDAALPSTSESPPAISRERVSNGPEFVTDTEFRLLEKSNITAALRHANWRIWGENGAAALLGLNPSTLKYRMKQLGVKKEEST